MKIINLFAYQKKGLTQNIGDLFTSLALKDYLKRAQDKWTVSYLNRQSINLSKYDLVVLGGGGLYHPGHLKDLSKNTNLFNCSTPLAILGLGLNLDYHQKISISFKDQIRRLISRSFINTVRDNLTANFLKELKHNTEITGCPSMYLPTQNSFTSPKPNLLGLNFALNHTDYYQTQSTRILNFIKSSIKPLDYKKLIICHAQAEKKIYKSIFPNSDVFFSTDPQKIFKAYKSCQLIIGMRGHSQIFSQAVNTPSLALPLNLKVLEPIKMAHKNYHKLVLSLDDSLSEVNQKTKYVLKNRSILVKEQQKLILKLKPKFLSIIKTIHEDSRFS